jgi:anthranilate synthase/aminodeoxychorismate synthase-like glutamine amidotransferase
MKMKILMIDNFDSFTYNLVQYLGEMNTDVEVYRNNAINLQEIQEMNPDAIVISPGPGRPENAGICLSLIREYAGVFPMLGVCLGHQAIAQAFGGTIVEAEELVHGKTSDIFYEEEELYKNLPNPFQAARYHSLIVDKGSLPNCLKINAKTESGLIMGITHLEWQLWGVQFHPESFLTVHGKQLLTNFIHAVKDCQSTLKEAKVS